MKKIIYIFVLAFVLSSCGGDSEKKEASDSQVIDENNTEQIDEIDSNTPEEITDEPVVSTDDFKKDESFIVISKKDLKLHVYAKVNGDTALIASYPVCLSRNKGQKTKSGDMKTPESEPGKPFHIKQIQDASTWEHDFGDGRGKIKAYGNWFLRLETPFNGIGIHGSTNNENTVPGRDSEGCIRLRDNDIIHLKENYAYVGMPVIIKAEEQGDLPFEVKALGKK